MARAILRDRNLARAPAAIASASTTVVWRDIDLSAGTKFNDGQLSAASQDDATGVLTIAGTGGGTTARHADECEGWTFPILDPDGDAVDLATNPGGIILRLDVTGVPVTTAGPHVWMGVCGSAAQPVDNETRCIGICYRSASSVWRAVAYRGSSPGSYEETDYSADPDYLVGDVTLQRAGGGTLNMGRVSTLGPTDTQTEIGTDALGSAPRLFLGFGWYVNTGGAFTWGLRARYAFVPNDPV